MVISGEYRSLRNPWFLSFADEAISDLRSPPRFIALNAAQL